MESLLSGIAAWIGMGGYAAFVWPAYVVAVAVLGGLSWQAWRAHRISERALDRLMQGADSDGERVR